MEHKNHSDHLDSTNSPGVLSSLGRNSGSSLLVRSLVGLTLALPIASQTGCQRNNSANVVVARNNASALEFSWFLAERINKMLDYKNLEHETERLDRELEALENSLKQTDRELSEKVARLRADLATKVDKEDIKQVVDKIIDALDAQLKEMGENTTGIEGRIDDIRELLGYMPTVTPDLFVRSEDIPGDPVIGPLTKEYGTVLAQSEKNRQAIEQRRLTFTEQDPEMQRLRNEEKVLLEASQDLHTKILNVLQQQLKERRKLRHTMRPTNPEVQQFDRSVAPLAWLAKASQPLDEGSYKGRIPVPKELADENADSIVRVLLASGVSEQEMLVFFEGMYREAKPVAASTIVFSSHVECVVDLEYQKKVDQILENEGPLDELVEVREEGQKIILQMMAGMREGGYSEQIELFRARYYDPIDRLTNRLAPNPNKPEYRTVPQSKNQFHGIGPDELYGPWYGATYEEGQRHNVEFDIASWVKDPTRKGNDYPLYNVYTTDRETGRKTHVSSNLKTYYKYKEPDEMEYLFVENGETLVLRGFGQCFLYDVSASREIYSGWDEVKDSSFSSDGTVLGLSSSVSEVVLVETSSGETRTFESVRGMFMCISPDGSQFTTADGRRINVYDSSSGELIASFDNGIDTSSLRYSDDGTNLRSNNGQYQRPYQRLKKSPTTSEKPQNHPVPIPEISPE